MNSDAQLAEQLAPSGKSPVRLKARIIIPVWGAKYVTRLDRACLPALLAPGNLPHLAEHFDCELTIVTQTDLFDAVRALPSVRALQRHCALRLVPVDDVLSHPFFYGYTITHALYRGFLDLGEAAKDVWCLFLNADFILADGSYRALVKRMLAGERCIFAPSYCTIEEGVWPVLEQRRVGGNGVIAIPKREMAGLVLDNWHFTIRSKIINWRMYRIDRVDQFYYLQDNDTLIGRQLPIAVVAFRPLRVPKEPVTFWDYGVVSEICPGAKLCVLGDSDDFLMMELRRRETMAEQLELGWMDKDEIARDLTVWTTKDQRDCGEFTLLLHRRDLPANLADGVKVLEDHYRDIMSRVAPEPRDYRDHYIWTGMIGLHQQWRNSRVRAAGEDAEEGPGADPEPGAGELLWRSLLSALRAPFVRDGMTRLYRDLFDFVRAGHRTLFGRMPVVRQFHPYYADLHAAVEAVEAATRGARRGIAGWSVRGAALAPYLSRWVREVEFANPAEIMSDDIYESLAAGGPYDFCLLELSSAELLTFGALHARLRRVMRKGAKIMVFARIPRRERVVPRDFHFISQALPDRDMAELRFHGNAVLRLLQRGWDRYVSGQSRSRIRDLVRLAIFGAVTGPIAVFANRVAGRRSQSLSPRSCTSLCLVVTVL